MIERIIKLIKDNNFTEKEICIKLGFNPTIMTNWKKGISNPTLQQITKLAEFFNTSTDFLIFGKETNTIKGNINNGIHNGNQIYNENTNAQQLEANGEIEKEILNICDNLSIKNKNKLLSLAYELEEEQKKGY